MLRRRLLFVLVLVPLALAAGLAAARAGSVSAQPIQFGVADDATKHAVDGGADLFQTIGDLGMTENRVTVWWDERSPDVLQERDFLDRMTSIARISGVRVVLAVQPLRARAFATDTDRKISLYAAYLERLARRYPSIRDYVIGNEPNQRRFLQPQHAADGAIVSAKIYERLIAASYDALRRVDPDIDVVGLATAPGGNDQRLGADNESVSPTRFIAALGSAYRASGRTRPLMDTVDVHAYAAKNDFPLTQRRMWPQAGPADLDRIKQAWWDAFHGTDQPLFEESGPGAQAAGGPVVRFRLDESGTQVLIDAGKVSPSLYRGKENIEPVSEAVRARYYADVVRLVECDSTVSSFLFFHLIDEPSLLGFQSGLLRVDGSRRPSYDSVRSAIADAGRCASPHAWRHTTSVAGARATFSLVDRPVTQRKFRVIVHAAEEVNAKAGVFPVADTRALTRETLAARLARGRSGALLEAATTVKGNGGRALVLRGALGPGRYAFAVLVRSTMNPDRTKLLLSGPFTVR